MVVPPSDYSSRLRLGVSKGKAKPCLAYPDGGPLDFNLWIQLKQVAPYDTRMKITVKAELNMMMKMLLKDKLQKGIDAMADQIAMAFNR